MYLPYPLRRCKHLPLPSSELHVAIIDLLYYIVMLNLQSYSTSSESAFGEDFPYHYWLIMTVMNNLNLKRKCRGGAENVRGEKLKNLIILYS